MKQALLPDWESHLVYRAQDGEHVAFELLADQYRDAMRSLALRMLRDPEDAADAVQESLVKAYRAIHSFHAGKPVLPWLLRICTNCCVDSIRGRKQTTTEALDKYEFSLCDLSQSVDDRAEDRFNGDLVRQAIDRLPDRYRQILLMRHFNHMEVGEIATKLSKPEGTIKSWLFRARAMLRKDLQMAISA